MRISVKVSGIFHFMWMDGKLPCKLRQTSLEGPPKHIIAAKKIHLQKLNFQYFSFLLAFGTLNFTKYYIGPTGNPRILANFHISVLLRLIVCIVYTTRSRTRFFSLNSLSFYFNFLYKKIYHSK